MLGARWARLSELDRARYEAAMDDADAHDELEPPPPAPPPSVPWPGVADSFYPLAVDQLGDLPADVETMSGTWRRRIGRDVIKADRVIEAPVKHLCETTWGEGLCTARLNEDVRASLAHIHKRLTTWATMTKPKKVNFDEWWSELPLFFVGHNNEGGAASAEDRRGLVLLLIDADFNPKRQIVFTGKFVRPLVGSTVAFDDLQLCNLSGHAELAR